MSTLTDQPSTLSPETLFSRVLVGVDGSPESLRSGAAGGPARGVGPGR